MSDCCVNIRFIYWYFQITTYKRIRFGINRYLLQENKIKSILLPFAVYEFDLRKFGTESIDGTSHE